VKFIQDHVGKETQGMTKLRTHLSLILTITHAVSVTAVTDNEFAGDVFAMAVVVDVNVAPVDVAGAAVDAVVVVVAQRLDDVVTVNVTQYSMDCTCSLSNTKTINNNQR
jgi:hypothetical protein